MKIFRKFILSKRRTVTGNVRYVVTVHHTNKKSILHWIISYGLIIVIIRNIKTYGRAPIIQSTLVYIYME